MSSNFEKWPRIEPKAGCVVCNCISCGKEFSARIADRKRGWARSCSKSCAATASNAKTGKFQKFLRGGLSNQGSHGDDSQIMDELEMGWDAHKDSGF